MDIIQILQKTFMGTKEEIEETTFFLSQQQGNPEYISCLLQVISNTQLEVNIRLAAAIQLRIQVKNELQLDFTAICTLIVISPFLVQLQLQIILYDFVKKRVDSGEIEQIIQLCAEFIQKDTNHALVSVLILRYLIKLRFDYNYEFIDDYVSHICSFFEPISTLISASLENGTFLLFSLFIHTSLQMASKFVDKGGPIPGIDTIWVDIISCIINQDAYRSPPFLDKDAIKLACFIYKYLPPEINANLLISIATHVIKGGSFEANAMSFMFLKPTLSSIEIFPMIESQQRNLVGGLFFRTFTLTEQDVADIHDNLYGFITNVEISAYSFKTPRNGAVVTFLEAVSCHPSLAQWSILIVMKELEYFRESGDVLLAYGALLLGGLCLQKAPEPFAMKKAHEIFDIAQSMLGINNFIYTAAFFQFIGLKPEAFNDVEILFRCFDAIINYPSSYPQPVVQDGCVNPELVSPDGYVEDPSRDLVQYFASWTAAKMLVNFNKETCLQIREEVNSNGSIQPLLSNVLRICKLYPTDQSSATIRHFTDFFVENIAPVALEYVNELFSIFLQYAREPHNYAEITISSCQEQIPKVCHVIREQRNDVPPAFFSDALFKIEEVSMQCDARILEDVLGLMACFTECMSEISDPFINVPQVLFNIVQRIVNEGSEILVNISSSLINVVKALIKINPEVVASTPQMLLPIVEIAKQFLFNFNSDSSNCENSVLLFQLIFIKLKQFPQIADFAPVFLQLLDEINPTFIADLVAALVHFNPMLTLSNERNFKSWMEAHPAAFLMGAWSVFQCWMSLPQQVTAAKDDIVAKVKQSIVALQTVVCNEDLMIFNIPEILNAFQQMTF